jgi:hypothetical protein
MLNKRIISAAAAVVVALGGFGAPVFGGIAQNFDIAASAISYNYQDFKANCIARGATNRMIEELDKFFLPNLDYFTAADYAAFIDGTDTLYNQFMREACEKAYDGKDPALLSDEERRDVIRNMGAKNQMKAYDYIRSVGAKHGVDVGYTYDEQKRLVPVCTITKSAVPEKQYIKVDVRAAEGEAVDYSELTVSIVAPNGKTFTQDADSEGKVEVTDLLKNGYTVDITMPGYAARSIAYDGTNDLSNVAIAKYGDLNGDGAIDLDDLILMQKKVAGWQVDDAIIYPEVANANADVEGKVDLDDLILEQKAVAGWNVTLGVAVVQVND